MFESVPKEHKNRIIKFVLATGLVMIGISLGASVTKNQQPDLKIGMKVTNGYCIGFLTDLTGDQATVVSARCEDVDKTYNLYADKVIINKKELKEVK